MSGDSYKVGYRKPPKHTRFRKGTSGNPKGRQRGTRKLSTVLEEELAGRITVSEGGQRRTMTRQEAVVKRFVSEALRGNPRAIAVVLQQMALMEREGLQQADETPTNERDVATIERFIRRYGARYLNANAGVSDEQN